MPASPVGGVSRPSGLVAPPTFHRAGGGGQAAPLGGQRCFLFLQPSFLEPPHFSKAQAEISSQKMTAPISANPVGEHPPLPSYREGFTLTIHPKGENKPFFPAEDETLFTKVCLKHSNPMRDFQAFGNDSVCKKIKGEQLRRCLLTGALGKSLHVEIPLEYL